jgi:ABC-2 type transport system ATP-binding protein
MPEHDCLPPDVTGTEFVTHMGRMSGLPATAARERAAESLRHVGLLRGALPADRRLFDRHEAAGQAGPGPGRRSRLLLLDEPTNGLDPGGRDAMLDLIARIGGEFGISIVVSSHLLGEVERICDHVVALERGGLLRADTMTSFTRVSQVLAVEVEEGRQELAARAHPARPRLTAGRAGLLVRLEGDGTYDVIRDVIADLGLPLNRLEQRRRRVEELFRDDQAPASTPR